MDKTKLYMHLKSFLALVASLTISQTVFSQEAQQVSIGDNMNFGITYSLPKTAVIATLETTCTKVTAGAYAAYAEKFLGLENVPLQDDVTWEIQRIELETVAKADTSRTFHIDFNEKNALPTFYLTDERCLWSINQKPEVKPATPLTETTEAATKLVMKASDMLTSEILKAGSKVKQAELLAQEIFNIRESRSLLVKGEADNMPGDGVSLQLMLDNLTAQEEALLSLFVGTTTSFNKQFKVEYLPEGSTQRELMFRFSKYLGLVDNDDMAGAPYYISVLVTEDNRMPEIDDKTRKKTGLLGFGAKSGEKGIAFCIPGKAHVSLFTADQTLASGEMSMGQFGHVEQLPASQFTDKKKPTSALFAPATGAIKIFEQTSAQ